MNPHQHISLRKAVALEPAQGGVLVPGPEKQQQRGIGGVGEAVHEGSGGAEVVQVFLSFLSFLVLLPHIIRGRGRAE